MPIIPNPPVPNALKFVVEGKATGGMLWTNIFHWAYTGAPPSEADCASLAQNFYTAFAVNMVPLMPVPTTIEKCECIDLSSSSAASGEYVISTPGTSSADKLPANVAVLVSKTIVRRYRGGRPRTYLYVGGDANLQDESHWNPTMVANTKTAYDTMVTSLIGIVVGGTTLQQEICIAYFGHSGPIGSPDYYPGTLKRLVPIVSDIPIDGYTVEAQIASQRGRIGRRA
jgi:hypothetical protein